MGSPKRSWKKVSQPTPSWPSIRNAMPKHHCNIHLTQLEEFGISKHMSNVDLHDICVYQKKHHMYRYRSIPIICMYIRICMHAYTHTHTLGYTPKGEGEMR